MLASHHPAKNGSPAQSPRPIRNSGGAITAAEDMGSKAVSGLKSAAVDFFKDMDWKHLSGRSR